MTAVASDIDIAGVEGLILDIDGTLYNNGAPTPGAVELLAHCRARGFPFVLCTQDAEFGEADIVRRLRAAGLAVDVDNILTAGALVVPQLRAIIGDGAVEAVATERQIAHLQGRGLRIAGSEETPAGVLLGLYGGFGAEDIERACRAVWAGAKLFTLAADRAFPAASGLIPGIGAFAHAVEHVTGKRAQCLGKPSRAFARAALARLGAEPGSTLVVGDTLDADIRMGRSIGARTMTPLTGATAREDIRRAPKASRPDWVVADVSVLLAALQASGGALPSSRRK